MKLDEAILEELLARGDGTVKQISERLSKRVYDALERLVRDQRLEQGWAGEGKTYGLPKAPAPVFKVKRPVRTIIKDWTPIDRAPALLKAVPSPENRYPRKPLSVRPSERGSGENSAWRDGRTRRKGKL